MKGNRQGFLSRSITRRSDQNSKIKYCFFILLFYRQLVGKVRTDFSDKLTQKALRLAAEGFLCVVFVRRERKSHKEVWFLWMMLYYPAKLSES